MSAPTNLARDVHRLLDIVVEEVSLVDRAANQHRFLVVKRSTEMEENAASSWNEDTTDLNEEPEQMDDTPEDAPAPPTDHPALPVAVAALERLTDTVERLGTPGAAAEPQLAALAADLHAMAAQLDAFTGAPATPAAPAALGKQLGSLTDAPAHTPPTPTGNPMAALLGSLTDAVRGLTGTVTAQQQRLARLEKHFGLPNSQPPGERPTRRHEDDTGWPLDLNQPLDRESVDKSLSFHDL